MPPVERWAIGKQVLDGVDVTRQSALEADQESVEILQRCDGMALEEGQYRLYVAMQQAVVEVENVARLTRLH